MKLVAGEKISGLAISPNVAPVKKVFLYFTVRSGLFMLPLF